MTKGQKNALKLWRLATLLAVCMAYANSFRNPFEFDDFHTVTDNPAIRSLKKVPRFFTDANTFSVLPANRTYRPMVSTSLAVDYALGNGYKPLWFHMDTFLWFLLLLFLLGLMYRSAMDPTETSSANVWLALFAAAWFGLHPAMAETVNYIIQRGDLYCTLDCVAALVIYARKPRLRKFGVYLLPLVTALLSKPPAAIFPALLLFYVFFFESEGLKPGARWVKCIAAAVPSIAVTAALMLIQSAMTPKSFAPSILDATAYRLVQPLVLLRYFGELFLPLHLNIDSDLEPMSEMTMAGIAGITFVLLLGVAIWWGSRQKRRYPIAYGLIWFVVTQLPTSLYPLSEVENDHRMFFSFVGLILAMVWAGHLFYEWTTDAALRVRLRPVLTLGAVLMLSSYAWGTHVRNAVWQSEESVWHDDVLKSPHNGRGLMIYGLALMNRGDFAGAQHYFTQALQYTPNYPTLEVNLGIVNGAMGNSMVAEEHFKRAITLAPEDDIPHAYYGRWLNSQGRTAEAVAELRRAVVLNPLRPMQHEELLQTLRRMGEQEALKQTALETLQVVPGDEVATDALTHPPAPDEAAYVNQSLALIQTGKFEEGIVAAKKALEINSQSAVAWNNIAAANEAMKRWDPAIDAAKKAVALKPDFQLAKNNLAWSISQKATENRK